MACRWLADMKALYETDLAVLVGRTQGSGRLGASAVRMLVSRWQRAGLAEARETDRRTTANRAAVAGRCCPGGC